MNNFFNNLSSLFKGDKDMKQQTILAIVSISLLSILIGFYSGRYYEQRTMRRNFSQRSGNPQQQRSFNKDQPPFQ